MEVDDSAGIMIRCRFSAQSSELTAVLDACPEETGPYPSAYCETLRSGGPDRLRVPVDPLATGDDVASGGRA